MIQIELVNSSAISDEGWVEAQLLQRDAFSHTLEGNNKEDIAQLVGLSDPHRFIASHRDPNIEVGNRFTDNQEFNRPRVAIAKKGEDLVGFAYSADNISGTTLQRAVKRNFVTKNYLWLREFVVHPDYQQKGIAKRMGKLILEDANVKQPVTAYIWPEVKGTDFLEGVLSDLGFIRTGSRDVKIFGLNRPPIKQVRMQATTVGSVLKKLK